MILNIKIANSHNIFWLLQNEKIWCYQTCVIEYKLKLDKLNLAMVWKESKIYLGLHTLIVTICAFVISSTESRDKSFAFHTIKFFVVSWYEL